MEVSVTQCQAQHCWEWTRVLQHSWGWPLKISCLYFLIWFFMHFSCKLSGMPLNSTYLLFMACPFTSLMELLLFWGLFWLVYSSAQGVNAGDQIGTSCMKSRCSSPLGNLRRHLMVSFGEQISVYVLGPYPKCYSALRNPGGLVDHMGCWQLNPGGKQCARKVLTTVLSFWSQVNRF